MSVGINDMAHIEDLSSTDTHNASGIKLYNPVPMDLPTERMRPIQKSPITLNLGFKKSEFQRIDRMNNILAHKLIDVTCSPELDVKKMIRDH